MSMMHSDKHLKEQSSLNFNAYVKLTRLTKEDIEQNTSRNHKKEKTSRLLNEWNTPAASIKQEFIENASIEIYETTIEHTSWQSTVQEFGINVKVEATDVVEVKTEQENRIRSITEGTTFLNYLENVNDNKFICTICYANFDNFEESVVHKNLVHKSKPYVCKVCNAQFVLSAHLNLHLAEHVNYLCMGNSSGSPSDIQSSSNVSNNFNHNFCVTDPNKILRKTKCKAFKCLNCVFATESETQFLNHLDICGNISNSSPKFHQCHLCTKSFKTHSGLNGHLKYHSYRSEIISRRQLALDKKKVKGQNKNINTVKSQKYVFPKIANFNRSFKCKDCNKHFTSRSKLNIHCKQHKQQMICNKCHKKFILKKNFEKHLLSHTNNITPNGISNDTLFNESNSPHNQRAITGSMKSMEIIKSTNDKNEEQNNLKNETFRCSLCNNYHKSKQSLSQHNRQHHSRFKLSHRKLKSKTVECNWCSLVITKCNLLRHIKSLHPNINPIKCLYCPMAFKDSVSLKLHTSRYHTI